MALIFFSQLDILFPEAYHIYIVYLDDKKTSNSYLIVLLLICLSMLARGLVSTLSAVHTGCFF